MEQHIKNEKMGISYIPVGDYYIPDIAIEDDGDERSIGMYGEKHRKYLKKHKHGTYYSLLTSGKLHTYLADLNEQAQDMKALLVKQMAEKQGVTEQLKAADQMRWVGLLNNITNCVNDVVLRELIYK